MPGNRRRLVACGLAALLVISTWAAPPGEAVPAELETVAGPAEDPRCRWETPLPELPEWCLSQVTGPSLITAIPDPRPAADDDPGGQSQDEKASRPDPVISRSQPPQPSPLPDRIGSGQADPAVTVNLTVDAQAVSGDQDYVEEGDTRTVTLKAALPNGASPLAASAAFTVSIAADTAESSDFTAPATAAVTINAGQTSGSATFSFTAAADTILEGSETVSLTSSLAGYSVNPASLTIRDADARFTVSANPTAVSEDAGASSVALTVAFPDALTSELTAETRVAFAVAGAGAVAGDDFANISDFTVAVAAGAVRGSGSVTLAPVDDVVDETSVEQVLFTGSALGRTASAAVTITDDDDAPAAVNLAVDVSSDPGLQTVLAEDAGRTTITVNAEFASGTAVEQDTSLTLRMSSLLASDFTVTIPKNAVRGAAYINITPQDNNVAGEAPRTVSVSMSGTSTYTVRPAEFTIEDDEEAVINLHPIRCQDANATAIYEQTPNADGCWHIKAAPPPGSVTSAGVLVRNLTFSRGSAELDTDFNVVFPTEPSLLDFIRFDAGGDTPQQFAVIRLNSIDDGERNEGVETIVIEGEADRGFRVRPAAIRIYDNDNSTGRINLTVDASSTLPGVQPSVGESSGTQQVTVTAAYADGATRAFATAVAVSVAGAGGTYGAEAADFAAVNNFTVNIAAGASSGSATFNLTPVEDELLEGPEDIALSGVAAPFIVNRALVTIDDDDKIPVVNLIVDAQPDNGAQGYVNEGDSRTVTLTASVPQGAAALTEAATFTVAIAADTAEAADFTAPSTVNLTIAAGQHSDTATFSFSAAADTVLEGLETVSVTSSLAGYIVNPTALTIRDEDSRYRLGLSRTSVNENGGAASIDVAVEFTTALTSELTSEIRVPVSVTGDGAVAGVDFADIPDFTVTVPAGARRGSVTVTLTPVDDSIDETAVERVLFTAALFGQRARAYVTIVDDDSAPTAVNLTADVSSDPGVQTSIAEDAGITTVTVTAEFASGARDVDTALRLFVSGETASTRFGLNPGDYTVTTAVINVTIPKNQVRGSATFRITPVNDDLIEGPETVKVDLHYNDITSSPYTFRKALITIEDNEPAVVNLRADAVKCGPDDNPATMSKLGEGDGMTCFEISGSFPSGVFPTANITVRDLTFTGGTATLGADFTAAFPVVGRNTITLTPGDSTNVTSARVDITALDDNIMNEGFETIVVEGRAPGYTVRPTAILLADNDLSANHIYLTVDADGTLAGNQPSLGEGETGQTVTVTAQYAFTSGIVRRTAADITVSVAAAGGARAAEADDFTAVSNFTLTIPAGQHLATGTFSLTTADDQRVEGAEDLLISGSATGFTVIGARLTIDDDDAPPAIALSADADDATAGTQTSLGEAAAATAARVTATVPDGKTFESAVDVTVSAEGPGGVGEAEAADFAEVENFTITIPAGQSSGSATFTLDPVEDNYAEGAEEITLSGVSNTAGVRITGAVLEIADNDDPPAAAALSVDLDGATDGDQNTIGEGDAAAVAAVAVSFPAGSSVFETDTAVTVTVTGEGTTGKAEASDFTTDLPNSGLLLTIPAGGRQARGVFTLTITDDEVGDDVPETITVAGSSARSGLTVTSTAITINSDNETRPASTPIVLSADLDDSTLPVETAIAEGESSTVRVTASLPDGSVPAETDTVVSATLSSAGAATAEAGDFSTDLTNGTLAVTIPAGSRSGSATFTLTAADDNVGGEGAETVLITGSTSAAGFATPTASSFTITDADEMMVILDFDMDTSTPSRDVSASEGGGPYSGVQVRARIALPEEPSDPQEHFESDAVLTVLITDAGEATAEAGDFSTDLPNNALQLTIPAGQTLSTGTFTLTVAEDTLYEGTETIALSGSTAVPGVTFRYGQNSEISIADNETRPVITLTVDTDPEVLGDQNYVPEGVSNRKITVTASVPAGSAERESDTVIAISTRAVTALSMSGDYDLAAWGEGGLMQLTLPRTAERATGDFALTVEADSHVEGSEAFQITGSAAEFMDSNANTIQPATVIIDDGDNPSVVYLRVDTDGGTAGAQKTVAEGATAVVTVTLTLPNNAIMSADRTVTVSVAGAGQPGGAEASDFTAVAPFAVSLIAGSYTGSGTFNLEVLDDTVADVLPELLSVSGSSSGWTARGDYISINEDNETFPTVNLVAGPSSVTEGASGAAAAVSVTASLTGAAGLEGDLPVTVSVTANGGSGMASAADFEPVPDFTLTISKDTRTGSASFRLDDTDDNVAGEGPEKILITGTGPSGVTVTGSEISIADGDQPPTIINLGVDADDSATGIQSSVTEGAAGATARVTASFPQGAPVLTTATTVPVTITGGGGSGQAEAADFTPVTGFDVIIPAGASSGSATFTLATVQDDYAEGAETITVAGILAGFTVNSGSVTIDDDDAAPTVINLSVDVDSGTTGEQTALAEAAAATEVTVTAGWAGAAVLTTDTVVTVSVAGGGGSGEAEAADFTAVTNFNITIPAGQSSAAGTFTLTLIDDDLAEGAENLTVSGTTAAPGFTTVNSASISITDDETPPTSITLTLNPSSVNEGDGATSIDVTAAFPVGSMALESATAVSVSVSGSTASAGSDFGAVSSFTVTIPAGSLSGMGTFTFTPVDDTVAGEGSETATVSGSATGFTVADASLTIADNDVKPTNIVLTVDVDGGTTGDQTSLAENAGSVAVSVTVSLPTGSPVLAAATPVTVKLVGEIFWDTSNDDDLVFGLARGTVWSIYDYSTNQTDDTFTITIPAGSASATGSFTLTVVDDTLSEGPETFQVTGAATGFTINSPQVTITDNDTTGITLFFSNSNGVKQPFPATSLLREGFDTDPTTIYYFRGLPFNIPFSMYMTVGAAVGQQFVDITVERSGTAAEGPQTDTSRDYDLTWSRNTPDGVFRMGQNQKIFLSGYQCDPVREDSRTCPAPAQGLYINDDNVAEGPETLIFTARSSIGVSNSLTLTIADNDVAPTVINLAVDTDTSTTATSETSLMEGDSATEIMVTASFPDGSAVLPTPTTVAVSVMDNTATSRDHLAVPSFNVTIPALATSGSAKFTLTLVDDAIAEDSETLDVGGTLAGFTVNPAMITIADNETITLTVDTDGIEDGAQSAVDEGETDHTVTVTATLDADSTVLAEATVVTVSVAEGGSDPADAADYTDVSDFTITIPEGDLAASSDFDLTTATDNIAGEGSETLSVSGSLTGYKFNDAEISITDLTAAPDRLLFAVDADTSTGGAQTSIGEGITGRTVEVSASFPTGSTVWENSLTIPSAVGAGTAENSDYSVSGGSFNLTIPALGSASDVQTFTLTTVDDDVAGESDALSIGSALAGYTVTPASLTITDGDARPTQITLSAVTDHATANDSVDEGTDGEVTVTAALSGSIVLETALTVPVVIAPGTSEGAADYTASSASFNITIPALASSGSSNFTLTAVDDAVAGETDAVAVNGGTLSGYAITGTKVKLIDKDVAPTEISLLLDADPNTGGDQTSVGEGVTGRTVAVRAEWANSAVQLENSLVIPVTVSAGTAESGDYSVTGSSFNVTLPGAGAAASSSSFTLTVNDDNVAGEIDALSVGGTLAGYTITAASLALGDSDSKPASIALSIATDHQTANDSVAEGTDGAVTVTASFPAAGAVLETALSVPVVIGQGTTDGADDYTVSSSSFNVSIPAGSHSGTADFTLTAKDDEVADGAETVSVEGGTLTGYAITATKVKIIDTDVAPSVINLTIDTSSASGVQTSVGEGVSGRSVRVWAAFPDGSAVLESAVTVPVVVRRGTAEASDYSVDDDTFNVTIGAGTRRSATAGTFSLTTEDDDVSAETDVLSVGGGTLSGYAINPASLTITDGDVAPTSVTLTVDADANTSGNQDSVGEGVSGRSVRVWAAFPDASVPREGAVTIPVTVSAGTAEASDYSVDDATFDVTIGAGTLTSATPGSFSLRVNDDNVAGESDALSVGGTLNGYMITPASVTLGDSDAKPSGITLTVNPTSAAEDGVPRSVSVWAEFPAAGPVLEGSLAVPVVVAAGTAEVSDYSVDDATFEVTIGAGTHKSATAGTFSLTVNNDNVAGESDALSVGGGALSGYTITPATLTLGDADAAPTAVTLTIDTDSGATGEQTSVGEGVSGRSVRVWAAFPDGSVVREGDVTVPVTVAAGTAEGSDYSIVDNTFDVTIGAGTLKSATAGTFSLTVNDDNVAGESDALSVGGALSGYLITAADLTLGDSDAKPSSITLTVNPTNAAEDGTAGSVSVWAEFPAAGPVLEGSLAVPVVVSAGTAEASDYSVDDADFEVTIGAGTHKSATAGSFTLTVNDDDVAGESDALSVGGGALSGYTITPASLTLGDADAASTAVILTIDTDSGATGEQTSVGEGVSGRSVRVWAAFPDGSVVREDDITVPVTVVAGTAEGSDYSIVDNTFDVTIGAGTLKSATAGTFSLTVNDDNVAGESDKLSVGGALSGYMISPAGLTLGDSDALPSGITLTVNPTSAAEGGAPRSVSVWAEFPAAGAVLEGSLAVPVIVSAGTAEASDYSVDDADFEVTIGAGAHKSATAGSFTLTVNNDDVSGESDALSVGGGTLSGYTITPADLTLGDADAAPTAITLTIDADSGTDGEQTSVGEGVSNRSVSVWAAFPDGSVPRESDVKVPVVVSAGTAEASDYQIDDNTFEVTIGAGTLKSAAAGTFSLTVNDDDVSAESDALSVGGTLNGYLISAADLTLGDADAAPTAVTLTIDTDSGTNGEQTSVGEGVSGRSVSVWAAFPDSSVPRESAVTVPVAVTAGTAEASDYGIVDNTFEVTIGAGTLKSATAGTFSLTVNDDNVAGESDKLSVGGTLNGYLITPAGLTLGDSDVRPSGITLTVNPTSSAEDGVARSVSVWAEFPATGAVLEGSLAVPVVVSAGTAEASDYTVDDADFEVTIGAGTHKSATAGSFTLTVNDDDVSGEADALSVGGGTLSGYTITAADLTLGDADAAPTDIALTIDADSGANGEQTSADEGVSSRSVSVWAAFPDGSVPREGDIRVPVTVAAGTAEGSDYSIVDNTFEVTIGAGTLKSASAGTFSLTVNDDNVAGESDALSVGGALFGYTVTPADLTLGDSDVRPSGITLTVNPTSSAEDGVARSVSVWAEFPATGAVLEGSLAVPVIVSAGTAEASDYSVDDADFEVTIGAGAHKSAAAGSFTLTVNNDDVSGESDALSVGGGTLSGYTITPANLTLGDADTAPTTVTLTIDTDSGATGEQTSVGEGVSNRSVRVWAAFPDGSVVLEGDITVPVTVTAGTAEASDYSIVDNTFEVTIGAGTLKSATAGTFSLTVNDDNVAGESDALSVGGALSGYTVTPADLTLGDSDAQPSGIKLTVNPTSSAEDGVGRSVSVWAEFPAAGAVLEGSLAVPVVVSAGTAEASDYSVDDADFTVTIGAGTLKSATAGTFSLTVNNDDVAGESDALSVGGTLSGYTITPASLTLGDADAAPTAITLSANPSAVPEGSSNRSVSVTAAWSGSTTLESALTVPVTIGAGTAEQSDYAIADNTIDVTIGGGAASGSAAFTVTVHDDNVAGESDELRASGAKAGYDIAAAGVTLGDSDSKPVQITMSVDADPDTDGSQTDVPEGVSGRSVSVWAGFPATGAVLESDVTVNVSVGAGTAQAADYSTRGTSGLTVTIGAGTHKSASAASFTLDTTADSISDESNEALSISGSVAGDSSYSFTAASLSITDGDSPPDRILLTVDADPGTSGAQTSVGEGVANRTVTVTAAFPAGSAALPEDLEAPVTVAAGTAEASDYSVSGASFTITIAHGQTSGTGTFTLTVNDDDVSGESDVLQIKGGTLNGYTIVPASLTLGDADSAPTDITLTVDADSETTGDQTSVAEGVTSRTVSVTAAFPDDAVPREGAATVAVKVTAGSAEAGDYAIDDNTFSVTIGAGTLSSATKGTFSLTVHDDNVAGETDALAINGSVTGYLVTGTSLTLGDSDPSPDSVTLTTSPSQAAEDGSARSVSVWAELPAAGPVLEGSLSVPVEVAAGTAEASDYSVDDADFTVTIGAGVHKSATAGSFSLTVNNDNVAGESDALRIQGGTLAGYTIAPASLTLGDADSAPTAITLSANPSLVSEGSANQSVSVTASWSGATVLESAVTVPVTIGEGTAEQSDYVIADNTIDVTIGAGAASGSASFTLTVHDDNVSGESDKLQVSGVKAGYSIADAGVDLGDSDTAPTDIAVTVDADPDQEGRQSAVAEGVSGRTVKIWAAFPDDSAPREEDVTVTVTVGEGTTDGEDDYSATGTSALSVTIGAGDLESATPASFSLTTQDDDISGETNEALAVDGSVSGAAVYAVTGAQLRITDGDTPPDRVLLTVDVDGEASGDQNTVDEGISDRTVTVTAAFPDGSPSLPSDLAVPVLVADGTAEDSDYSVSRDSFTITIAAGASSGTATFTLTVADDNVAGETDAIEVKGGSLANYTIEKADISITDADVAPTRIILSVDDTEVPEGASETITITAAFPAGSAVLETGVRASAAVTAGGSTSISDYVATPANFNIDIAAGAASGQGSFRLRAADDDVAGEHDFVRVTGSATGFTLNDPVTVHIKDTDLDPAGILLSVDKNRVDEGTAEKVTVTAVFDGAKWDSNTMVEIKVEGSTAEEGDFQVDEDDNKFTVTIYKETSSVSRSFQLTANRDTDRDDEEITITGLEKVENFPVVQTKVTITDTSSSPGREDPGEEDPPADPPVDTPPEQPGPPVVTPPGPTGPPPGPPGPPAPGQASPAPARVLSSDASLRSLRTSPGTLSPTFAPAGLRYELAVSANVWTVQVAPVPNHERARVTIDGTAVSGAHRVFLGTDRASIEVVVTAEDGTVQIYRLAITRGTGPGFADALPALTACTGEALRPVGFEDVAGWFSEDDINCIGYYGITLGRSPTRFAPSEVVPRWQMALFLFRAAGPAGINLPKPQDQGFTDISGLSEEAKAAANMMAQLGVMPGSDGKFDPQGKISRALMAMMLDAFLGLVTVGEGGVARDSVEPDLTLFSDIDDLPEAGQLAIRRIFEMGVTRGTSQTAFKPGNSVTRGQMAQFIARTLAHTIARPVGVSIQTDPSTRAGGRVDVVVSVRDENFRPVTGAPVDLFTASDPAAALTAAGSCAPGRIAQAGPGSTPCAIDARDPVTGRTGDLRATTTRTPGTAIWAWTAPQGAKLNDSHTPARLDFR